MSEVENRNQSLVKAFFETLSTGNLERLRPLLHDQETWTVMAKEMPGAGEKKWRDVIIEEFLGPVRGLFEDGVPKVKIDRMICQGSFVAAETRGLGRLKNGKEYRNAYAFVIEIKGEKVFSLHEYMDSYYVSTLV